MARWIVPKVCGADVELGNALLGGVEHAHGTGFAASRLLLAAIDGVPQQAVPRVPEWTGYTSPWVRQWENPLDIGRKFLPSNGGCVYIDSDHLEVCIPEVCSAYDHVAASHAMLRIARRAQAAVNAALDPPRRVQVLVNNSDGQSNSYGSHLNFLTTRRAWDNLFHHRLHYQQFLASFQASSIILTGQGKVGAENGAAPVRYQIAQRADFFETLTGEQTTHQRPLLNSRNEPLCGSSMSRHAGLARYHCIFYDSTLCHGSSLLRVGPMQILLAMLEAEEVPLAFVLEDPLSSVHRWSHDPSLRARSRLLSGRKVTATELQWLFLEKARRFSDRIGLQEFVPRVNEILVFWEDTLQKLEDRNFDALAQRLDWVLKLQILERVLQRRSDLTWSSPQVKHLDLLYGSLETADGLYWALEADGRVERLVSEKQIQSLIDNPPPNTRAWTRAMLLRRAGREATQFVDWDAMTFVSSNGAAPACSRVDLANPLRFTRALTEHHFEAAASFTHLLERLDATAVTPTLPRAVSAWGGARYGFG